MTDPFERGPDCPTPEGSACQGFAHRRYCTLVGCGHAGVGPEPTASVRATYRAMLAGAALPVPPRIATARSGLLVLCIHRNRRGHCGEWSWTCALGHGQAGIIEPETDCTGCTDATS